MIVIRALEVVVTMEDGVVVVSKDEVVGALSEVTTIGRGEVPTIGRGRRSISMGFEASNHLLMSGFLPSHLFNLLVFFFLAIGLGIGGIMLHQLSR